MILKSVHTGSIAANYKMSLYFLRHLWVGQMPVAKFSTSLKMFSHRKGVSDYAASLAQEVVNVTRKRDVMVDSVPVNNVATLVSGAVLSVLLPKNIGLRLVFSI